MSEYVPRPDIENINVSRSTPLRDAFLLMIGFVAIAGVLLIGLTYAGGWLAQKISPEMEAKLFSKLGEISEISNDKDDVDKAFAPLIKKLSNQDDHHVRVGVMCDKTPNAFAVPGGLMLMTSGLITNLKSENGLAFVMGHELGHFKNRDHLTGMGRKLGLMIAAAFIGLSGSEGLAIDFTQSIVANTFNRHQESAADDYALGLLQNAYGHFNGAEEFFNYILESEGAWQGKIPSFLMTHPNPKERLLSIGARQKSLAGKVLPLSAEILATIAHCKAM